MHRNFGIFYSDVFGFILAAIVIGFLGYKGIACVRDPVKEREKLLNSVTPGPFQDLRRAWTPVWFVRLWGILACSMISLVLVILFLKLLGVLH